MKKLIRILLAAAIVIAAVVLVVTLLTPWMDGWGASQAEVSAALPGDVLVLEPAGVVNRAVTVHASPEQIYPWIVQMGADKGGLYSYTALESLIRCPMVNADRLHPEWQDLKVGDPMRMCPTDFGPVPYEIAQIEPNHAIVMGHQENGRWTDTWQFVVIPQSDGTSRLITRTRTMFTGGIWDVFHPMIFFMERGMLLGIKERAETLASIPSEAAIQTATPRPPAAATPLAEEPPTPTPEIFIARTQAIPGPEVVALPVPCIEEHMAAYVNIADGYCFAFPKEFSLVQDTGTRVSSGPLSEGHEPLIVTAGVQVFPAGDQTLDDAVEAFLAEFVGPNPPWEISQTALSFRTESARLLDPLPGLGSSRAVIILHHNRVYRLLFYPSPVNADGSLSARPGDPAYDTFQALFEAIINSFSFLDDPADTAGTLAFPITCFSPDQAVTIDAASGTCSPIDRTQ
jgi:hypothetical protein